MTSASGGRVALVTGATSGIGSVIAEYFADRDHAVILLGRNAEAGQATVERLRKGGLVASFVATDVRQEDQVERAFGQGWDEFGTIDVVVNCAGLQIEKPLHKQTVAEWDLQIETNLRGYFLVAREGVRRWLSAERHGTLVHISSGLGIVADALLGAYSVTKAGQILLSHALAVAYGPHGIRSNVVCPGSVATEAVERWASSTPTGSAKKRLLEMMYPMQRIATPSEVAAVVYMLASDEASAVSGSVIAVDGGFGNMSQHNILYSPEFVGKYES